MRTVLTCLVWLMLLCLCPPGAPERPAALTAAGPALTAPGDPGGPAGGVAAAQRQAVWAVNEFWTREFGALSAERYQPPIVSGGYRPACAGRPSLPGNAFYCVNGDFLAWDEDLMVAGYQQIGAAWVYLIISHEWGHAIQARLHGQRVSLARELQADCLAGAALAGAGKDNTLVLPDDVTTQLGSALTSIADRYPWTNVRDHGDARQRAGSFNLGSQNGARACLTR